MSPPPMPEGSLYDFLRWLDFLFGRGVDDDPLWLLAVRLNVLLFVSFSTVAAVRGLSPRRLRGLRCESPLLLTLLALTALAALLRFSAAEANLLDFGGIPYSRLLLGYRGHFAVAQLYSLLYEVTGRDIEHAILFNRIAGTLTIPLVYLLCRRLRPGGVALPAIAAFLFAVSPLHILFSASDSLAVMSLFLTALTYLLLAAAEDAPPGERRLRYLAAFSGLALLTQVRYENVLFLIPPALFLLARRRALSLRALAPGALLAAAGLALYGYKELTSELSFQNPVHLGFGFQRVVEHLVLNPFLTIPVLFAATMAVALYRGPCWGALAVAPWIGALLLPVLAESGHARVFCSWLIPILPLAAYGISLLLASPRAPAKLVAVLALAYLGAQPLWARAAFSTRYLEMRDHDFFRAGLSVLPAAVTTIIVPDDEMMRRRTHSTVELSHKYLMTLAGVGEESRGFALARLTDFLEEPGRFDCGGGACAFFFGLPCLEQDVYPFTPEQCAEMLRGQSLSPLAEETVVAAPFLHCSIYVGARRDELCAPTMRAQRLAWYHVDSRPQSEGKEIIRR